MAGPAAPVYAAGVAGYRLWKLRKHAKKAKRLRKPARKGWRWIKKGGKWTYVKAKRGTQWVGEKTFKHYYKGMPHPSRPWTYRRWMGAPEGYELVTRGPEGYYEYKKRQYRDYKRLWELTKRKKSKRGPGSARKRTGRPKSRKTMRARSAPKPKMVRYRKGGCPPGYRYDPRRKMCIQNTYK